MAPKGVIFLWSKMVAPNSIKMAHKFPGFFFCLRPIFRPKNAIFLAAGGAIFFGARLSLGPISHGNALTRGDGPIFFGGLSNLG
eukprot:NODE_5510_length_505_cov_36.789474_g4111_i0.p1 GENE.NODE_5510_length_505_cov_36.789474_g4111_i0~~NODE_5510_length_505_cov_36.789474_g4111_i0.p1  ORF type:complete len:96 (-),score=6.14 NODE_5510_length_505_cov_36.789474_g4111_i0:216-467(-)